MLTCSGLAAVCVPRGGGEAPPKARLAALSSHRLPHAHTVSHPQAASMSDHGFARGRLACGAKRSEGGARLCTVPFVGSGTKPSSLRRRKERGEARLCTVTFVGSGPKPTSLRRKKEGGKSHALGDARVEASMEPGIRNLVRADGARRRAFQQSVATSSRMPRVIGPRQPCTKSCVAALTGRSVKRVATQSFIDGTSRPGDALRVCRLEVRC